MKKGVTKMSKRISAWLLTLVMIVGLVAVPAKEVKAASLDEVDLKPDTTEKTETAAASEYEDDKTKGIVEVSFGVPEQYNTLAKLKAEGITKLQVTLKASDYTVVKEGETAGAQAYIQYDEKWKSQWENLKNGQTITVTLDISQYFSDGEQINAFGVQFANLLAGTSITYQIISAKLIGGGSSSSGGSADFGTTRDYSSGVTATLTNQKDPTNDWSGFDVTINNNSSTTICDWIIVLEVPSGTASAFKCWNAVFVADGDTIYLYPMQSGGNAVISPGTFINDAPGGGFGGKYVDAPNDIKVKAVYYNKGTSSSYDYSSGETNDDTSGSGGDGGSSSVDTSTNKDLDVEYNYAKLLQESLYFYDANMCGYLKDDCAIGWRGNCHTYDDQVTYSANGKSYNVNASGGFHDAGDHVKFGLPQGYAATMLGISYYEFEDAYTDLGQKEHLKTITDYFCDYFRRCTVYESGKVIAFCYQVGEGSSDHSIWSAPEGQTLDRPAYFADASNPATDQVSVAIAALAMNYKNFGNAEDLKVAKDLFTFVQNSESCATKGCSGFYDSGSWKDDYALAAAALWIATNDSSYKTEYENKKSGINQYWVLDWDNSGGMASMLMNDSATLGSITDVCKGKPTIDTVFHCVLSWGSCRYSAAEQFTGLVYDKLTNSNKYTDWATSQMNYMIGDNPNKRCYYSRL